MSAVSVMPTSVNASQTDLSNPLDKPSLKTLVLEYERTLILNALNQSKWHQRRAAASLGLLPTTLLEKMKRLGIRRNRGAETASSPESDRLLVYL